MGIRFSSTLDCFRGRECEFSTYAYYTRLRNYLPRTNTCAEGRDRGGKSVLYSMLSIQRNKNVLNLGEKSLKEHGGLSLLLKEKWHIKLVNWEEGLKPVNFCPYFSFQQLYLKMHGFLKAGITSGKGGTSFLSIDFILKEKY